MKRVLLLTTCVLMISSVAMADHFGIYTDATGVACTFAPGFTSTATVIHKFTVGATGARFKITLPAGSTFFSFSTPYTPVGDMTTDLSIAYGQCLSGSIVLGNIVAILTPGAMHLLPADLFPNIIYTNCLFAELPATGGSAGVGSQIDCFPFAVEPSTWGSVKALYR